MATRPMPKGMQLVLGSQIGKALQQANVWLYKRSHGRIGGKMNGAPVLLLTTRGRKTGKQRTTPLLYLKDGAQYAVVASKGGWPQDPLWYRNLQSEPSVDVQIGADVVPMTARTASDDERKRLWPQLCENYAPYADYQSWTDRLIPVVLLSPRA